MTFQKTITETALLAALEKGQVRLPPLTFSDFQRLGHPPSASGVPGGEALVTVWWQQRAYRFVVESRRLWTPKATQEAVDMLRRISAPPERYPLLLVPYLSEERLAELEAAGVSGVDLCGNGVVVVPGELLVLRSGAPNRFRWEGTIKNVYRKESSLAARIFLLVREFGSVGAVLEEIQRRGGELTLSTVSKVCKALEADLIIRRELRPPRVKRSPILPWGGQVPLAQPLRLLQPEKLLDLLAANYTPPQISGRYTGKCEFAPMVLREQLAGWAEGSGVRIALTGASSVEAYAVMAREPVQAFYCSDVEEVLRSLGDNVRETDRFANVAFLETSDGLAYFDRRPGLVASPVQTYLELVSGDKRERETAEQVRRVILEALARDAGKE